MAESKVPVTVFPDHMQVKHRNQAESQSKQGRSWLLSLLLKAQITKAATSSSQGYDRNRKSPEKSIMQEVYE